MRKTNAEYQAAHRARQQQRIRDLEARVADLEEQLLGAGGEDPLEGPRKSYEKAGWEFLPTLSVRNPVDREIRMVVFVDGQMKARTLT
jgi:hypothetical protein